jgi:hypothetical protein
VLVAAPDVAAVERGNGFISYEADRVVSDGSGGAVLQVGQDLVRLTSTGRYVPLPHALSTEGDEAELRLEDFALIEGDPHIVYLIRSFANPDAPYQEVWTLGLDSGSANRILRWEEFESTLVRASVADDVLVVTVAEEGTTYLVSAPVVGALPDTALPFPAEAGTGFDSPIVGAVLSPDAATLLYAQIENVARAEESNLLVDLVAWDLRSGTEIERLRIDMGTDEATGAPARPGRIDFDGSTIVLERYVSLRSGREVLSPFRIAAFDGSSTAEVGMVGVPSIAK